jgi:hypothetical protein
MKFFPVLARLFWWLSVPGPAQRWPPVSIFFALTGHLR